MFRSVVQAPKGLSIMLTYTCPAECTDCGTLSSPRSRENISLEAAKAYIEEAASRDFRVAVFTGGEATLRWKDLLAGLSYAREKGLKTRLVTNAHWATRESVARTKLRALIAAGLDEINYSTGDEHARFIPLERVALACRVAIDLGLSTFVMVESRKERAINREVLLAHPEILAIPEEKRRKLSISESPWMPLNPLEVEEYQQGRAATAESIDAHRPCHSLLNTWTIQADGRVGACCGLGMRTIPELNMGVVGTPLSKMQEEAESDLVKLAIHYLGPMQILRWASGKDSRIQWEGMYAHQCQACARLYSDPRVQRVMRAGREELKQSVAEAAIFDEGVGFQFSQGTERVPERSVIE
ncbi:MAG: radical SAM protein [Luteibacter sp.]|uniref:radical SAM protein n=1 Tax=Luteibacter sp. TaxID=1886636 RepID=UPI00280829AE|nr:radical SAM protein [Luteibacter sp.]MDQ7995213.1 radical SAM protein [Luteibacter sp.]